MTNKNETTSLPQNSYSVGDVVEGEVAVEKPFGFFVRISKNDFGLLKVANLTDENSPSKQNRPSIGETLTTIIIEADLTKEGWRLNLSQRKSDFLKYGRGK